MTTDVHLPHRVRLRTLPGRRAHRPPDPAGAGEGRRAAARDAVWQPLADALGAFDELFRGVMADPPADPEDPVILGRMENGFMAVRVACGEFRPSRIASATDVPARSTGP